MAEKFVLLQANPIQLWSNVLVVLYSNVEQTRLYKTIVNTCQFLNTENRYSFFTNDNSTQIVAIDIDLHKRYQEYQTFFSKTINWLIGTYGKTITISLPECDNLQSIAMGLFKILNQYVSNEVKFNIYTEEEHRNILKPMVDSIQFLVNQNEARKNYLIDYFKCFQCGKFPYLPVIITCCEKIVCGRCANRDIKPCVFCGANFEKKSPGIEIETFCKNAPYLCKCGQSFAFLEIDRHLKSCFAGEIECRICNEMTKFSNFIAHFRMCHMEQLLELVNESKD